MQITVTNLLATVLASTALLVSTAQAEMASYELDPAHTTVYFTVDHIGYAKTLGIFTKLSGTFMYDAETKQLGKVNVNIDSASVESLNKARDKHVRSADFLNVKSHAAITFTAAGGDASNATNGTNITGDLTILGKTLPVTLEVTLNKAAKYPFGHKREVLGLSMSTAINRSDFGMTYGVGNGLVGDEVIIQIETEAIKMK